METERIPKTIFHIWISWVTFQLKASLGRTINGLLFGEVFGCWINLIIGQHQLREDLPDFSSSQTHPVAKALPRFSLHDLALIRQ